MYLGGYKLNEREGAEGSSAVEKRVREADVKWTWGEGVEGVGLEQTASQQRVESPVKL